MSVFLFMSASSAAIGEAFVCQWQFLLIHGPHLTRFFCCDLALSEDPLLVWNYGTMGIIAGVAGILFWISVRRLDAQEDALNNLDAGHVD